MTDTTNVMKGVRSGVQHLNKKENPYIYDVGCICHLADLTVNAGMKSLPVNIDQFFVNILFCIAVRGGKSSVISGALSLPLNQKKF